METRQLGKLWPVSALTLGGGGIGQLWGKTDRQEAIATVKAAVDAGITLLDMAPAYGDGEAEVVIGETFNGKLPNGIRITTKHRLGSPPVEEVEGRILASLEESLSRMRLDRVDILFLHSNIVPDDYDITPYLEGGRPATRERIYYEGCVPVFERLKAEGRIGAWGITGIGIPDNVMTAMRAEPKPDTAQVIANIIDSPGSLKYYPGPTKAREMMQVARKEGVGVLGIRAVQAGALTDLVDRPLPDDHPEMQDYARAGKFRALAAELGTTAAILAHRYALFMDGVETLVLGVKNRRELAELVAMAAEGPLDADIIKRIDACF